MNSKVLQDGILPTLMIGGVLVLVQVLSVWSVFAVDRAGHFSYCPR